MHSLNILILLTPFLLRATEPLPFDLTFPDAVAKTSEIKQERYEKMQVFIKGEGYTHVYGHTWAQGFKYPKFENGEQKKAVPAFFIEHLSLKEAEMNRKDIAHFTVDGKEYWLKLSIFYSSYSYVLLRVEEYPKTVTLDESRVQVFSKDFIQRNGVQNFPSNIAIAHVQEYAIDRCDYKKYNEYTFRYNRKAFIHKGEFWKIDFEKTSDDPNSCRYSIAHDYKANLLQLGATILKDEDNDIVLKLEENGKTNYIKFKSYNRTFSLIIIQEEPFVQSLVLSPDTLKSELDKKGQITLDGIYFEFNKATLRPESRKAILSTVALMQRYSDLVLSVHGHTDSEGSEQYNMTLSKNRAAAVIKAIAAQGIESSRLQSNGFGESMPIATNDTDEGRAKNRRVELHKVRGGDKKSLITIDFIKPLDNAVVDSKRSYDQSSMSIHYTKPYAPKKELVNIEGHLDVISYKIMLDGVVDKTISRKEIIKNYENIIELYNAEIIGKYGDNLYFKIKDRGDGVCVFGLIECFTGSYAIRLLSQE